MPRYQRMTLASGPSGDAQRVAAIGGSRGGRFADVRCAVGVEVGEHRPTLKWRFIRIPYANEIEVVVNRSNDGRGRTADRDAEQTPPLQLLNRTHSLPPRARK